MERRTVSTGSAPAVTNRPNRIRCDPHSAGFRAPRKQREAMATALGPLSLVIAMAASPGAVAIATIVSVVVMEEVRARPFRPGRARRGIHGRYSFDAERRMTTRL